MQLINYVTYLKMCKVLVKGNFLRSLCSGDYAYETINNLEKLGKYESDAHCIRTYFAKSFDFRSTVNRYLGILQVLRDFYCYILVTALLECTFLKYYDPEVRFGLTCAQVYLKENIQVT